ncbi:hypothetical protein AFLA_001782 [Aspergillus flavus NRRL3357]|nr:hypothetical protein AFLA_001782 [Aspergillus flavus NRRL3357]
MVICFVGFRQIFPSPLPGRNIHALVATTLNIASESEMKAGAKRALAECLETDDLYSEVVNDAMWTENSAELRET